MKAVIEDRTFGRYLWDGLKSFLGVSAELKSDKQKRLGTFLLLTGVLWIFIPITSFTLLLQWSQVMIGAGLLLHGYYLVPREHEERREETLNQVRIGIIKHIADRDGVNLEEAEQTFEEMERWVREAREEEVDRGLELAMVKGKIQLIEMTAERLGISIKEATEKVKKMKKITISDDRPWPR